MLFKNLPKNTPIFVIEDFAKGFKVYPATLLDVSHPRYEETKNIQQYTCKVVDLNINYNNQNLTYTINENQENYVSAPNHTILVIDQQNLVTQLKSLKLTCESTIKKGEFAKSKIGNIEKALEEYDVSFKEKKETDEKINKLTSQMNEMNANFNERFNLILDKLNNIKSA